MASLAECTIRKAEFDDIENIMKFIERYWNPNHILCKSRKFFEWQHYYHGEVCFIIAENNCRHEIEGIVGYIPYSEEEKRDVLGALWKVRNNHYPMLGLKLKLYLMRSINAKTLSGIGLNKDTLELHRRSGSVLGKLKHYYLLSDVKKYNIAVIAAKRILDYNQEKEQFALREIKKADILMVLCEKEKISNKHPRKSFDFICHRYWNHPVYRYQFWGIYNENNVLGTFIMREVEYHSTLVLRIVDYIGDVEAIAHTGKALQGLLKGYEYIDFYLYGIEDDILRDAGFVLQDDDVNIIPNYFEPFVQKNISLDFYADSLEEIILFKGDGDQDRPNFISGDLLL